MLEMLKLCMNLLKFRIVNSRITFPGKKILTWCLMQIGHNQVPVGTSARGGSRHSRW